MVVGNESVVWVMWCCGGGFCVCDLWFGWFGFLFENDVVFDGGNVDWLVCDFVLVGGIVIYL